jgi:murein DD-endopeptidase MepM/ murein hydrolase activator NlpD
VARGYVVKRGDTLRKIAKAQLGDGGLYLRLAEFNGLRDPDRIVVGQRIEIPSRRELAPPPRPAPPRPAPPLPKRARVSAPRARAAPLPSALAQFAPPHGLEALCSRFGDLYAYLREDGTLDPRWETEQLTRATLPFAIPLSWDPAKQVRSLYCHRKLAGVFTAVFDEIERRGLRDKVRTYGGCFNFRTKRSGNKLSTHAWGIAVDLNPETNGMGRAGDMPLGIVSVFEAFGFTWGGRWTGAGRDPMHFQFCSGY